MLQIEVNGQKYNSELSDDGLLFLNGEQVTADLVKFENGHYHLIIDGKSYEVENISSDGESHEVKLNSQIYKASVKDETMLMLERLGMSVKSKKEVKELKAPMPGLVLKVAVEAGQEVKEGDPLVVLEAMKMENVLKSPVEAKVKAIKVSTGDAIDKNGILIEFE